MTKYTCFFWAFLLFPIVLSGQFAPLCTGSTNGFVVDFANFQNEIYATGFFTKICGKSTGNVAKWNGSQWTQAAMGGIDEGHALEVIDNALYIASYEFGTDSNYVVRWNGTNLTTIGTVYRTDPNPNQFLNASIYDILKYKGEIVACGEFNWVAGKPISGITRWNGLKWDSLGAGLSGSINANTPGLYPHQLLVFEEDLIVCGNFLKAGGQIVNGVARWDGQNWHALGDGFNNPVYGLGILNGELYAGGGFTASGNTAMNCIAKWNGTSWENPGFGFEYSIAGVQPFIHTLKQIGDSLFIAGGFDRLILSSGASINASGVVVLNNSLQINTLGGGIPNKEIEAIIPYNNGVLLGGGNTTSSGYLGVWNPATSAIETLFDSAKLTLFPNPASDFLDIRGLENHDFTLFSIRDLNGRSVFQTNLGTTGIQLPALPQGMYVVQCSGSRTLSPFQEKLLLIQKQ
jgi:hypothetical protein